MRKTNVHLSVGATSVNININSFGLDIVSTAVGIGDTLVVLGPPAPDSKNENSHNIDIYRMTEDGEFIN